MRAVESGGVDKPRLLVGCRVHPPGDHRGQGAEAVLALRTTPGIRSGSSPRWPTRWRRPAKNPQGNPWFRAVYADDRPVGLVMLSWNVEPQPPEINGPWFLWKLLIDHRHQGKGYGRVVVREIVELVRGEGATELLTSYVPGEGGPAGFYARLGFVPTGALDPGGRSHPASTPG